MLEFIFIPLMLFAFAAGFYLGTLVRISTASNDGSNI